MAIITTRTAKGIPLTFDEMDNNFTSLNDDIAAIKSTQATPTLPGLLSAADKIKIDGIDVNANNYVHPNVNGTKHPPVILTQHVGKVLIAKGTDGFMEWDTLDWSSVSGTPNFGSAAFANIPTSGDASATEVVLGSDSRLTNLTVDNNGVAPHNHTLSQITDISDITVSKLPNLNDTTSPIQAQINQLRDSIGNTLTDELINELINEPNGIAGLDAYGKLYTTVIPDFLNDVIESASTVEFPITGTIGKVYVSRAENAIYRWSNDDTKYVRVSSNEIITSHSALTDLTADDHPQYLNTTRADARYSLTTHNHIHKIGDGVDDKITYDTDDRLNIIAGSNVTIDYNDTANSITVNSIASGSTTLDPHTISATGDATWSVSFDGSANVTGTITLANTTVTPGSYTKVTVDSKGRVTSGNGLTYSDIPSLDTTKITSGVMSSARLGTGTADSTTYLRGDGTWAAAASAASGTSGVSITNDTTTDTTVYPTLSTNTSGSQPGLAVSSSKLSFNPSTGQLTATAFNSLSDKSFKINIKPIRYGLETVMSTSPVSFDWIDTDTESFGFIAQDLETIIPEAVSTNDNVKTVNYSILTAILFKAVQDLSSEIQTLKLQIGNM